eukprot:4210759-Ditylum_brightwellii.AAC.1
MMDEQTKKLIFDQHLEKWRIAYNRSGQAIETDTPADIVQFMSDEKGYANKEEENCRGKRGNDYNKGREKNKKGWFNKNNDKNNNKEWDVYRGVPDFAPYPKHGKNHTLGGFNGKKSYNGPNKNNNSQVSGEQYLGQLVAKIVSEEQQKNGQSQGGLSHNTLAQGASMQNGITWGRESHFSADDGRYGNQPGNGDN